MPCQWSASVRCPRDLMELPAFDSCRVSLTGIREIPTRSLLKRRPEVSVDTTGFSLLMPCVAASFCHPSPPRSRQLRLSRMPVVAFGLHQLGVGAALRDVAAVEDDNAIPLAKGAEAVGVD